MEHLKICMLTSEDEIKRNAEIAKAIWNEYFSSILSKEQIEYMVEMFQSERAMKEQMKKKGYQYYGMFLGEVQIGYFAIQNGEESMFLSKLYLKKEYRKKGYSSVAFEYMINMCREKGLRKIWLTVNRHNDGSIAVYKKKGFVIVREEAADIGKGFVMDDYIMEKNIE